MQRHILILGLLICALPACGEDANSPRQPATDPASSAEATAITRVVFSGKVLARNVAVSGAILKAGNATATSGSTGEFRLEVPAGSYQVQVSAQGHPPMSLRVELTGDTDLTIELNQPSPVTIVKGESATDPSSQVNAAADLQPSSGLPGVPFSLPGLPAETASGGVKAPQYFAPGVAGDHGEPIAQYIQIGDFLFPNNLPANAHGNGYADPNLLIAPAIGEVETDSGAFDVRHGNHAVNLAVAYGLRPAVEPFLQVTSDGHDYDFVNGWSFGRGSGWALFEAAGGNGFLALPERRRQYKLNVHRTFTLDRHRLTLFLAGYYGSSRIPGLAPVDVRLPQDTIDPRQSDRTHTELVVANDAWQISENRQAQFSGFIRTYGLSLRSNFGGGLIRQSEFRTVSGGNASYTNRLNGAFTWSVGLDARRDAPRNAELARADSSGLFQPVTLNDFTIGSLAPYAFINGALSKFFDYNLGVRREEIFFNNQDRLRPGNSDQLLAGVTAPRATISVHVPDKVLFPILSFSYGEGFHTNDPRIGAQTEQGTPVSISRAFQMVATEFLGRTQLRVTLNHVNNSQELARIDPDTGLQENVGPSLVRSVAASVRRDFSRASFEASFARAEATSRLTGESIPEAPRLIWEISASRVRLPAGIRASASFEYLGHKPLSDGFTALPVREMSGSLTRSFQDGLFDASLHFLLASGFSGQTLETLQLENESAPSERIVGVRKTSYAGITLTYHLGKKAAGK